jgi:hypothetical protein
MVTDVVTQELGGDLLRGYLEEKEKEPALVMKFSSTLHYCYLMNQLQALIPHQPIDSFKSSKG